MSYEIITDEIIIFKFLKKEFKNDSVGIYLYCCGNDRSKTTAINKAITITNPIFKPFIDDDTILNVIKVFFEFNRNQYILGNIFVKPIY